MSTRSTNRPPAGGAAKPPGPDPGEPVDEGPMRRELLRQIAQLETELSARRPGWAPTCTTDRRGPALQPTAVLEGLRNELLAALEGPSAPA